MVDNWGKADFEGFLQQTLEVGIIPLLLSRRTEWWAITDVVLIKLETYFFES